MTFIALLPLLPGVTQAAESRATALAGQVTSQEEGPMEGVLISAKHSGSSITITVISDEKGHYQFPASKLGPGQYSLSICAVGYSRDSASAIEIAAGKTAIADLRLHKAQPDVVASQLSNWEWLASFPGSPFPTRISVTPLVAVLKCCGRGFRFSARRAGTT